MKKQVSSGAIGLGKLCAFCGINQATQTDSHIFTKSLCNSMMRYGNERRVYKIDSFIPSGNYPRKQDTPKESYLFCPQCENQIFANKLETPIVNSFYNNFYNPTAFFGVNILNKLHYRNYWNTDYKLFKQFVYLQLFRAHVSTLDDFIDVKLTDSQVNLLKNSLKEDFTDIPLLVITCDQINEASANVQFCTFFDRGTYIMWINDFIYVIFFPESMYTLFERFRDGFCQDGMTRIVSVDLASWNNFKSMWFSIVAKY